MMRVNAYIASKSVDEAITITVLEGQALAMDGTAIFFVAAADPEIFVSARLPSSTITG